VLAAARTTSPLRLRAVGMPVLGLGLTLACGGLVTIDWSASDKADASSPLLRVVQPNISQLDKWSKALADRNNNRLAALSGKPGPEPRLLLWPEAATSDYLELEPGARARIASLLGPKDIILTGADSLEFDPKSDKLIGAHNSLFAMDASGGKTEMLVGQRLKGNLGSHIGTRNAGMIAAFLVDEEWEREGKVVGVSLKAGDIELWLAQDDGAKGWDRAKGEGISLNFNTAQDVDMLATGMKERGGVLDSEPTDMPWGARSSRVRDPDGYKLSISKEKE
jgi:uncharacterized glyoxalase superfamily protein PhnB